MAGSAEGGLERLGAHRKVQETLQVVTGFRYPEKIFRLQTVLCYRTRQRAFPPPTPPPFSSFVKGAPPPSPLLGENGDLPCKPKLENSFEQENPAVVSTAG